MQSCASTEHTERVWAVLTIALKHSVCFCHLLKGIGAVDARRTRQVRYLNEGPRGRDQRVARTRFSNPEEGLAGTPLLIYQGCWATPSTAGGAKRDEFEIALAPLEDHEITFSAWASILAA